MWKVEFYRTASGKCPTADFLESLSGKGDLDRVQLKLTMLEMFGNQLHRPQADYLEDGIYELRIQSQRKQIRLLYFFFYQDTIVISHGLRKEAKIPAAEIAEAKKNRTDYFSRHKREK